MNEVHWRGKMFGWRGAGVPERQKGKGERAAFSNGTFNTVRAIITINIGDIR